MAEKLKNMFFQPPFFEDLAESIKKEYSKFNKDQFKNLVFDDTWEDLELKAKMHHVTECLHKTLPEDYPEALEILRKVAGKFKSFDAMVFPDYAEQYGLNFFDLSMPALAEFNKGCSSEFAVRPFLDKDPELGMSYMYKWTESDDEWLRRLSSEGCRPRLPWAMALPKFKNDPSPILPILEKLKEDESEYVRRSVSNNLNDISKDNPEITLEICERWYGMSNEINKIVKHACRDMLKSGNKRALMLFGFGDPDNIHITNLDFNKELVFLGDKLEFTFDLELEAEEPRKIRLEYGVFFVKANGKLSRKIFQIKEALFDPGITRITRKQQFINLSTRKHYPGEHFLSIIVNGEEKVKKGFVLMFVKSL